MVDLTAGEPQYADEYGERTNEAVKAVLVEIAQVLGDFAGRYVVIGGAVPWLLLENDEMPHVGTLDIDIALAAAALGDGHYATLIEALEAAGYAHGRKAFQLERTVPAVDGGPPIKVVIDFLRPDDVQIVKNIPPIVSDFAVIKGSGTGFAVEFYEMVAIAGRMPMGGVNKVEIAVASIPALLVMKGFAIGKRYKQKDAYDIYYCVRNYRGGIEALAAECMKLLEHDAAREAFAYIEAKFDAFEGFGPTCVRRFIAESRYLGDRTPDEWQQDAFGQVDALLKAMGLRASPQP